MAPLLLPRPVRIPIRGRHVFITGGSSGIGLAMARLAAAEGARVSILARDARNLEAARDDIRRATGAEVAVYSADVRDEEAVVRAVGAAGVIDVLVCCHGVFPCRELEQQSMEEVNGVIDINLTGTFRLIKAALPGMKSGGDGQPRSIALVSSQAGQVGVHGFTAYSASKFALRGLGEALQQEIIADNIHVSIIFPPTVETPGLIEVNKTRPKLSAIIASTTQYMEVNDIARKSLDGIKSGKFFISFGHLGAMLSLATAGLAPQRSFIMAFLEVLLSGFLRLIGLFTIHRWYYTIEQWHAKQKRLTPRLIFTRLGRSYLSDFSRIATQLILIRSQPTNYSPNVTLFSGGFTPTSFPGTSHPTDSHGISKPTCTHAMLVTPEQQMLSYYRMVNRVQKN